MRCLSYIIRLVLKHRYSLATKVIISLLMVMVYTTDCMNNNEKHSMGQYLRAVNYLHTAQIFLADNHLMTRPITLAIRN